MVGRIDYCRNCGNPDSWHDEDDGACPDDDGPHPNSEAAYEQEEREQREWDERSHSQYANGHSPITYTGDA